MLLNLQHNSLAFRRIPYRSKPLQLSYWNYMDVWSISTVRIPIRGPSQVLVCDLHWCPQL